MLYGRCGNITSVRIKICDIHTIKFNDIRFSTGSDRLNWLWTLTCISVAFPSKRKATNNQWKWQLVAVSAAGVESPSSSSSSSTRQHQQWTENVSNKKLSHSQCLAIVKIKGVRTKHFRGVLQFFPLFFLRDNVMVCGTVVRHRNVCCESACKKKQN